MAVNRRRLKKSLDSSLNQNHCKTSTTKSRKVIEKFNNQIDIIRTVKCEESNEKITINPNISVTRILERGKTKACGLSETSKHVSNTVDVNKRTIRRTATPKSNLTNHERPLNKICTTDNIVLDNSTVISSRDNVMNITSAQEDERKTLLPTPIKICEEPSIDVNTIGDSGESPKVMFKIVNTYTLSECSNDAAIDVNNSLNEYETRRGRKRKIINYASLIEDDTDDVDEAIKPNQDGAQSNPKSLEETLKRKRGRPKGYKKEIKSEPSVVVKKEPTDGGNLKKRGLPRGKFAQKNTHHVGLVTTIFQQSNNRSDTTNAESEMDTSLDTTIDADIRNQEDLKPSLDTATVTCAVCKLNLRKSTWSHHKYRSHNNLAWRVGDKPLDLNDSTFVMRTLTDLYKRKKPLYCENCNLVKKSVVGYLSHKSICQKSSDEIEASRVKCVHCERILLPVSMPTHLKLCKSINTNQGSTLSAGPKYDDVSISSKRKAATKAERFLKNFRENDGNENNKKRRCTWYVNFDFQPTAKGKNVIQDEISRKGSATCWFDVCNFESVVADEMAMHISKCQFKPSQGYTCKYCFITYSNEDEVAEHINQDHNDTVSDKDFECDDADYDQLVNDNNLIDFIYQTKIKTINPSVRKHTLTKVKFLIKFRHFPTTTPLLYPPAHEWTYKFCAYNFSSTDLFPHWKMKNNDLTKLDNHELSKYLPVQKYSVCTASIQTKTYTNLLELDHVWKRFKLFESDLLRSDTSTFFCGGAITAMAWLPTPYDDENSTQILAVSTNGGFNKGYAIHRLYGEPGLIQFWNCGILKNIDAPSQKPLLQFCLAHDHGPVWCLEWCPSGCYDKDLRVESPQRLGVLAVGSADSHIYIYSMCLPDSRSGKILKLKPVLKLLLNSMTEIAVNGIEAHVTKLCWTRAKGHEHLAAGYANGMIGIFHLNSTSDLLNIDSNNDEVKIMLPYQVLSAHHHAVTALYLYHLNDGCRWLMSASLDRTIKYWDLENPLVPLSNFTKSIVRDGVWLSHWISTVHTYEDCCGGGLTISSIHQLRNFKCVNSTILHSNSCVSSISGSDWTNSFVQGNAAGEVTGFFPHQLFYYLENEKSFRLKKGVLGYARVIEKNASIDERLQNEKLKKNALKRVSSNNIAKINQSQESTKSKNQEPTNYEEADDKYGLVFCDLTIDSIKELPDNLKDYHKSNTDKFYPTSPHIYPLQSITQIVINPNSKSYCYYATGYQAGFVRISNIKYLSKHHVLRP